LFQSGLVKYRAGRLSAAEKLFRGALSSDANHAEALQYLGLVAHRTSRPRLALRLLRRSAEVEPRSAFYACNVGNLLYGLRRLPEALCWWGLAARRDGSFEEAFANTGRASIELGQYENAAEAYRKAAELNPDSADAYRGLSIALHRLGCSREARTAARRARALADDPLALSRFGVSRLQNGMFDDAIRACRRAARLRRDDATLLFNLAGALAVADDRRGALRVLKRALALEPEHSAARFLSAALQGELPAAAPADYIAAHFDTYAGGYDRHLVTYLRYRGPELLWRATARVLQQDGRRAARLRILDAGCGTGLAAALLGPAARWLAGIDLSRGMIKQARARQAYDDLVVGELVRTLRSRRSRYDLIFAADVFCYFGDLATPFMAARRSLNRGGLLALTVEAWAGASYVLQPHARYAHSRDYLRRVAAAAGLGVRSMRTATLRYQMGKPVRGIVAVLERI
jgi:predicted TPR repeat methyltransferase